MSSSLPEQFAVRAATAADADAVAELARASEVAFRGESALDVGDVRERWRDSDDAWVVSEDDRVVAAATLFPHGAVPSVWADVHPDFVGRGLGSALLDLTENRARERGATAIRNDVFADDVLARRLLEARAYHEIRRFFEMRIEFGDQPPPSPEWPAGLRVEQFRTEDAEAFHGALTEAFEEEFSFVAMPFEEWRRVRIEADDFDARVWSVVRDGDDIAAVARCDPHRYGGGWVGAIGVRKPWRRRGVGLALLLHTFGVFHARGARSVGLGVDTQNPTGATRLYERAGMAVQLESIVFEKELA